MLQLDDPADFGVWGKVREGQSAKFRRWTSARLGMREIDVHRLLDDAVKGGRLVEIYAGYGWFEIPVLLATIPDFIEPETVAVSASGLMPSSRLEYCVEHALYYGRIGGCPVCTDDMIRYGHRAK